MLSTQGRIEPKAILIRLERERRLQAMEFVIRGWMEIAMAEAEEFLKFAPGAWSEELASRLMAIVRARPFEREPGRVIEEILNGIGTPLGSRFY